MKIELKLYPKNSLTGTFPRRRATVSAASGSKGTQRRPKWHLGNADSVLSKTILLLYFLSNHLRKLLQTNLVSSTALFHLDFLQRTLRKLLGRELLSGYKH